MTGTHGAVLSLAWVEEVQASVRAHRPIGMLTSQRLQTVVLIQYMGLIGFVIRGIGDIGV